MNYPISVFLDSNVFIACKYNTSKDSELGILLRYIKGGKINLFLSNIVKREVESHISEDVDVAIGQLKKPLKIVLLCSLLKRQNFILILICPQKNVLKIN